MKKKDVEISLKSSLREIDKEIALHESKIKDLESAREVLKDMIHEHVQEKK